MTKRYVRSRWVGLLSVVLVLVMAIASACPHALAFAGDGADVPLDTAQQAELAEEALLEEAAVDDASAAVPADESAETPELDEGTLPAEAAEGDAAIEGGTASEGELADFEEAPILLDAQGNRLVPIGRLYNKKTSEHLYTKNANEYNALDHITRGDWVLEGVAWYAPETSNTPVYRLYNKRSGDHHYTTDKNERDTLVAKHGWTSEGIAFYSDDSKSIPIYRVYNSRLQRGQHHYTTSRNERDTLCRRFGWKNEGVGFYAVSATDPQGPIFRELQLDTTYTDLDVNCDGINDSFLSQMSHPSYTFQLSHNGFARAKIECRGAKVYYWKYDKTNVFIIVERVRNYGNSLLVLRCEPDVYPRMSQFTEVLSVDFDDRNTVAGVNGKRLTVQSTGYRGGEVRQHVFELNPTNHMFRQV